MWLFSKCHKVLFLIVPFLLKKALYSFFLNIQVASMTTLASWDHYKVKQRLLEHKY
jgi:hypothetical protein